MKILQLTDIHLTAPGKTIGGRDPNVNFDKALKHASEHHPDAEVLVITGDLSDWGEGADYERLKARLADVTLPVRLCIGNHDDRPTLLSVFPELANEDGHVQQVFRLSEGIGMTLDTWGPESHAGHLCDDRLRWLDRQLTAADQPVYLFLHHNPIPTHNPPMDQIMLLDADALGEVVSAHRERLAHIIFGHCHQPLAGSFHGVPVSAPRGTNHASWVSFSETEMLLGCDLPESYAVLIAQGPSVTVHMIEFGYAGEIRDDGTPDYADWDRASMAR